MTATALLPYLVHQSQTLTKSFSYYWYFNYHQNTDNDISTMLSNCPPHPIVIVTGDFKNPNEALLVCEKKILCEISIKEIPIFLLAVFYAFNMCYPKDCTNFYTFLKSYTITDFSTLTPMA